MLIVTTIDVSPEVYRYFLHKSEMLDNISPEKLMSDCLEEHVRNVQHKEGQ